MRFSPHSQYIQKLIKQPKLHGTLTRQNIADLFAKEKDGYPITTEQVRSILRQHNATDFTVNETVASNRAAQEAQSRGVKQNTWKEMWLKDEETSIRIVNDMFGINSQELIEDSLAMMRKHSPAYPKIKRSKIADPHMFVVDPADIHIGKLALAAETGQDYNIQIAKDRCIEGVHGLMAKVQAFPLEEITLVIGNDVLHFDTTKRTTTSGTPQDTDGQLHQIYLEGLDLYVQLIDYLLGFADIRVVYNPSNHDYMSGYMLAQTLAAWYRNSKNITFDVSIRHRKYFSYGRNLIGTSHGDGAKHTDMPTLMAQEHPDWSNTVQQYRYIYLHHLHHRKVTRWQSATDTQGVTVHILRSPSAPDGWHDRNGFCDALPAVEGFVHHKEQGQVATLTHYLV